MHFAIHGHTAAELIVERAVHTKDHMGLITWADAPDGKIKKRDVTIAKNYLSQDEMNENCSLTNLQRCVILNTV